MTGQDWRNVTVGGERTRVRVLADLDRDAPYLWPSVGEYPVYDDYLYHVMLEDEPRNKLFRDAIAQEAPGATVVELGCGPDLLWTLCAAEAGAARVFAADVNEDSAARAADLASTTAHDIRVFGGEATTLSLPEPADLCIAELVGNIGGAEGIDAVLADARRRHLKPGAATVPAAVGTRAAAVCLDDLLGGRYGVRPEYVDYVERLLDAAGGFFDLRFCVGNVDRSALRTTDALVEDLCLDEGVADFPSVRLDALGPGRVDGLLLWLNLRCAPGQPVLDSLDTVTNWLPVYVPFAEPFDLADGDVIELECRAETVADDIHPDYAFTGALVRADGGRTPLAAESRYAGGPFRASRLHRALFESEPTAARRGGRGR
ncbi:SAM-dependent methyltransferase [Saccharothrix hoggarensis]|uniref:Methyltransferase family protein n=1 Tax=Saccharothrix hoggarensis TaxID=913853 RepID=A0ABW3R3L9_9PSEU